jgi:hypothetical protein
MFLSITERYTTIKSCDIVSLSAGDSYPKATRMDSGGKPMHVAFAEGIGWPEFCRATGDAARKGRFRGRGSLIQ